MAEDVKNKGQVQENPQRQDSAKKVMPVEAVPHAISETVVQKGAPHTWKTIFKMGNQKEGWAEETKAMQVPGGCVVALWNWQRQPDGSVENNWALTFVPGVKVNESDGIPFFDKADTK